MRQFIARLRWIRFAPRVHARHYFLNFIGGCCKLADKLFRSTLHERFKDARMGAVVEHTLEKKPLNLRLVWQQLRSNNS